MHPVKPRVDYDRMAEHYDEPSRDFPANPRLQAFLGTLDPQDTSSLRILNMGRGTGKQPAADLGAFPSLALFGLDRYRGMLRLAQQRSPAISWVPGDNSWALSVANSFDYVTNQFSYHHVADKARLIRETFRVIRPGGRFAITNLDPWAMPQWWSYTSFPASRARDMQDFLPVEELSALLASAGFRGVHTEREHQAEVRDFRRMLEYAGSRFGTSQLIALPDLDYQDGISQLRQRAREGGPAAAVPSEICLVFITADRP